MKFLIMILGLLLFTSCGDSNHHQLHEDLRILSSDKFEGRKPGTKGSEKAQNYIVNRLKKMESQPFNNSFVDTFDLQFIEGSYPGTNIQAIKRGSQTNDKIIVISAHYDHLGIKENKIYNGANDNATGVSVLLNLISMFKNINTNNSIVYLFLDAEEFGKQGVKHFLSNNPELHDKILLNFNIDMLNCNSVEDLYICGTIYSPQFKQILKKKVKDFNINFGHDEAIGDKKNWLKSSDHAEFANWGIPFLYFGSEEEEYYNTPEDDFENINLDCFNKTLNMAKEIILELDQHL